MGDWCAIVFSGLSQESSSYCWHTASECYLSWVHTRVRPSYCQNVNRSKVWSDGSGDTKLKIPNACEGTLDHKHQDAARLSYFSPSLSFFYPKVTVSASHTGLIIIYIYRQSREGYG